MKTESCFFSWLWFDLNISSKVRCIILGWFHNSQEIHFIACFYVFLFILALNMTIFVFWGEGSKTRSSVLKYYVFFVLYMHFIQDENVFVVSKADKLNMFITFIRAIYLKWSILEADCKEGFFCYFFIYAPLMNWAFGI